MPGVSKEQIARAKKWDLLSYLQKYEPDELVRTGPHEYSTATHGSLKISNSLWHWFKGDVGGKDALSYLVRVRMMGFVEAVEAAFGWDRRSAAAHCAASRGAQTVPPARSRAFSYPRSQLSTEARHRQRHSPSVHRGQHPL